MVDQIACHMIHSQSQLSDPQNIEWLKQAKVVIVGAGWPDYTSVKAKAPDAKLLVSFNTHMIYYKGQSQLSIEFQTKLFNYLLKDDNGWYVDNIDYPSANWEFKFSKDLAKAHAKAIWKMIKDNPQIDGVYMDDLFGVMPDRYVEKYSTYYGSRERYQSFYLEYRESLLRSLLYRLPNEYILVCNTAGALTKGASGISIEQHYSRELSLQSFKLQKGFWCIDWFRDIPITIENSYLRVLEGVRLNN